MCSGHERNLVISLVVSYVFYLVVSAVLDRVGLRGLGSWLWLFIPAIGMWLAYGMSPKCAPMIPTCLVQDIIYAIQVIIPSRIIWPDALQAYPGCLGPTGAEVASAIMSGSPIPSISSLPATSGVERGSEGCILSCRDHPFYFRSWESTLSWALCGIDPVGCLQLELPYFPLFRDAVLNHTVALNGTKDTADAFSFCFWVTMGQAIPWMLLAILAVYTLVALVQLPFLLLASGTQFVVQAIAYTHAE